MNSARFHLVGGASLILVSILICLFSVWGLSISESPATPVSVEPTNTPPPIPDTPTPMPDTPAPEPAPSENIAAGDTLPETPTRRPGSPTPTSPSPIRGIVNTASGRQLNLRRGPGTNFPVIASLTGGAEVTILQRTQAGDWLQVETENQATGWASSPYIEIEGASPAIPVAVNLPPTPTPASSTTTTIGPATFNVYNGRDGGDIPPNNDRWYTFFEGESPGSILLVLMFEPNVNYQTSPTLDFFLYNQEQIPVWPPHDPDLVPNFGAGGPPGSDRDGDLGTGELVWRGGPLQRNTRYYLRIINRSTSLVRYCLMTEDVIEWRCP